MWRATWTPTQVTHVFLYNPCRDLLTRQSSPIVGNVPKHPPTTQRNPGQGSVCTLDVTLGPARTILLEIGKPYKPPVGMHISTNPTSLVNVQFYFKLANLTKPPWECIYRQIQRTSRTYHSTSNWQTLQNPRRNAKSHFYNPVLLQTSGNSTYPGCQGSKKTLILSSERQQN